MLLVSGSRAWPGYAGPWVRQQTPARYHPRMDSDPTPDAAPVDDLVKADYEALARFRFAIRRYLRVSEETVRALGLTPQHYQLLLAIKGFPDRDWATIRELAERLQLRHHSVVGLVDRAQRQGLITRSPHPDERRAVAISLTNEGALALSRLVQFHRELLRQMADALTLPDLTPASGVELPPFGPPPS